MITAAHPWTTIEQAELLQELIGDFLAGRPWTLQQRKDARILVSMLIDYSRAKELTAAMNATDHRPGDKPCPAS